MYHFISHIPRELSVLGTNDFLNQSAIKLKDFRICGLELRLVGLFYAKKIDDVNAGMLKRVNFSSVLTHTLFKS